MIQKMKYIDYTKGLNNKNYRTKINYYFFLSNQQFPNHCPRL